MCIIAVYVCSNYTLTLEYFHILAVLRCMRVNNESFVILSLKKASNSVYQNQKHISMNVISTDIQALGVIV